MSAMKKLKKPLLFLLAALLLFVAYLLFNTFTFESQQISAEAVDPIAVDPLATQHFSQALQFKTISTENPADFDSTDFKGFARFLEETYPLCDSLLDKRTFNEFSFLYHLPGSDPSAKPVVFLAHLDVVPVIDKNLSDWREDPFGGKIVKDTVWGRGAIDDKNVVISLMESMEKLLKQNFQPSKGIYIALVHDEEIGGIQGAKTIAAYMEQKNIQAEFVLDEGGYVTQRIIPGIDEDIALIGVAEKGFLSLDLSVKIEGGHSSIPAKETGIDVLARAVSTLKENPFPSKITPAIGGFIDFIGPELPFGQKLAFANSTLFESVILGVYEEKASGSALVRTTTAPTLFHAGVKDNVVPQVANATINFRILPGETISTVKERVRKIVDDERITISEGQFRSNPSAVSDIEAAGFKNLQLTLAEIYPGMIVSPYLMVGATDSRHFFNVAENIYRFTPIRISPENIKSFHGLNECLAVKELENSIRFYTQLIKNTTTSKP